MGIPMSVDVREGPEHGATGSREATEAVDAAFAVLRSADERFSPFLPESELNRYARGETAASDDLREILDIAARAAAASGGAFTVRSPDGSLDTNGIVKGWAAQRAADVLVEHHLTSFCLNAGGDVVTRGEPEPGRPWRTGVRDPWDPRRMVAVVEQRDGAVATSGTYERGAHVWDGRTGEPARCLVAATVVAADLTTADVLATSVLALGPDEVPWAIEQGAREAFAILPDGRVLRGAVLGDAGRVPTPAAASSPQRLRDRLTVDRP